MSWYPTNEANADKTRHPTPPTTPITDLQKFQEGFQDLVSGVAQTGCGLEAQLESVYRFLIQPDPWLNISVDGSKQADLGAPDAIDFQLLQQRADFLREDSLLAIVMLTDEDDSSADPLSLGGHGWAFMASQYPGSSVFRDDGKTTTAPRGTSACLANPGSPDCTSCACDPADASCAKIRLDPECQKNGGYWGPAEDSLNVRFHRMKQRFGVDPQFPIQRYVNGLTKSMVPDRGSEHPTTVSAEKGRSIKDYENARTCQNPLFAKNLPRAAGDERCHLERSGRNPGLIFFAVLGGVPNKLLHFDPDNKERSRITADDWNAILGRDPANFDFGGIDPHMIASVLPRDGIPPSSETRGDNGNAADPVGRDWQTGGDDLQFACTFSVPVARNCIASDPSCDCGNPKKNPPLCGASGQQIRAKAYPTLREFMVVRALGDQGIAGSICPISLTESKDSALYGYNGATQSILDRLRQSLAN